MKKILRLAAFILAISIVMAGCSGGGSGASTAAPANSSAAAPAGNSAAAPAAEGKYQLPADSEKVELRFSWWGSDSRHDAMQAMAKLYTDAHPNVTITPEYGAFDGWQQKVLTQLSGKSEPDVLQVNYNWVHSFGKGKNVFFDLNELAELIDLSQWDKEQLNCMTVDGQLGAVPHGVTARANLYNKVLFQEAGIDFPATYADMVAAGAIIAKDNTPTGANNKYVQTHIGKHSTDLFIAQMLYDKTGKIMQENGKVNYTVDEVKEVLEIYKSFEDSGAMPTFEQEDPIQNESNPVWTSGRSGGVYEWVGTMDKYLDSYKDGQAKGEIGVAPYMTVNAGDNVKVFVKPSLGYAVSKNTKNPAQAADFLNFMFTDDAAIKTLGTSLGVSSNHASAAVQESEGMVKGAMKEGYELLAKYEQVVLDPYFEDENVRGQRYIAVEEFRTGKSDSATAAKNFIDQQNAELEKLYR